MIEKSIYFSATRVSCIGEVVHHFTLHHDHDTATKKITLDETY